MKDKTPRDKKSHLVYGFKCPDKECHQTYVGESKQALQKRLQQHRQPSYGDTYDSALYTHTRESGHSFENKDVVILDRDDRWFERGVKEAAWERIEQPSLTSKLRFTLSCIGDHPLRSIRRRLSNVTNNNSIDQQSTKDQLQSVDGCR